LNALNDKERYIDAEKGEEMVRCCIRCHEMAHRREIQEMEKNNKPMILKIYASIQRSKENVKNNAEIFAKLTEDYL